MYTLTDKLYESLLDDEDDLISSDNSLIEQFLKDNYNIDGSYTIKNGIVDAPDSAIKLKNLKLKHLTNDLFKFGSVREFICSRSAIITLKGAPKTVDYFSCRLCGNLKSLEGAPEKVSGVFNCRLCERLKTLEGAPEFIDGDFNCSNCPSLISLKGAPKKIKGRFDCSECEELISLEGGPESVGGDYNCCYCQNLQSIKGVAKKIGGTLDCSDCAKLLIDEVRKEIDNINCKNALLPK